MEEERWQIFGDPLAEYADITRELGGDIACGVPIVLARQIVAAHNEGIGRLLNDPDLHRRYYTDP